MSYRRYAAMSETAENSYKSSITLERLNAEYTFNHFRQLAAKTNEEVKADKAAMDTEIENIRRTYSQKEAINRIEALRKIYSDSVEVSQDILRRELKDLVSMKAEQLQKNVTTAPKSETLSMLQALSMRTGRISEAEISMLVSVCGNNYQALSIIHDMAEKSDCSFRMPYTVEGYSADLEEITGILNQAINELGADGKSYRSTEFYNYTAETNPEGYLTSKFSALDTAPALNVVLPNLTLKERLEQFIDSKIDAAADKAVNGEDNTAEYSAAVKAKQFLNENEDIATDEDAAHTEQARRTELETEAAKIMSSANE